MPLKRTNLLILTIPDSESVFQTKVGVMKLVGESHDFVIAALKSINLARLDGRITKRGISIPMFVAIDEGNEHQTHHRGQTTVYQRLKGVPPPEPF